MTLGYDCGFQRVKAKAPKDLSLLVDSLGFMINVMLEMTSSVLMQSETQTG